MAAPNPTAAPGLTAPSPTAPGPTAAPGSSAARGSSAAPGLGAESGFGPFHPQDPAQPVRAARPAAPGAVRTAGQGTTSTAHLHDATPQGPGAAGGAGEARAEAGQRSAFVDILVAGGSGPGATGGTGPATGGTGKNGGAGKNGTARGRRARTALIATVSGVSVLALAAAIVWLTPTDPVPKAENAAATGTPASRPTAAKTGRTRTSRPTPQSEGTPSAVPTGGQDAAARLRILQLRPVGTRAGGCWTGGGITLQALVARTGGPLTIRYAWLVDGAAAGPAATTLVPGNGRRYLTPPAIVADRLADDLATPGQEQDGTGDATGTGGTTHRVTLRITAPVVVQRSVTVTLCAGA
ncbi:hypothetical protein MF672_034495 [Actinomadura sp. ATCC 31491]|uniref:Uncharacterized protein n=1 Tax=Actinomadura luzonensis TaxID=2805427 RepID=A0ABT0G2N7_9ACTN|nr:hypothetical protein [Actinomadura luzonensis]MCK2218867.1 hypothetical protein [Actinomadura luzonensis]